MSGASLSGVPGASYREGLVLPIEDHRGSKIFGRVLRAQGSPPLDWEVLLFVIVSTNLVFRLDPNVASSQKKRRSRRPSQVDTAA